MAEGKLIPGWIGQFEIGGLGGAEDIRQSGKLPFDTLLDFLCTPGVGSDADSIMKRYAVIGDDNPRFAVVPGLPVVLEKFYWPMRNAKASFMLGNYLSVIALCGFVAEMVAIFLLEWVPFNETPDLIRAVSGEKQAKIDYGKWPQDTRVNKLRSRQVITKDDMAEFTRIRKLRRQYLHYFSKPHDDIASDALVAYRSTAAIVAMATIKGMQDGGLILTPALQKMLAHEDTAVDPMSDAHI
ncbi:MAG TPA: hypothetical protein VGL38_15420 [bacterium]